MVIFCSLIGVERLPIIFYGDSAHIAIVQTTFLHKWECQIPMDLKEEARLRTKIEGGGLYHSLLLASHPSIMTGLIL